MQPAQENKQDKTQEDTEISLRLIVVAVIKTNLKNKKGML